MSQSVWDQSTLDLTLRPIWGLVPTHPCQQQQLL